MDRFSDCTIDQVREMSVQEYSEFRQHNSFIRLFPEPESYQYYRERFIRDGDYEDLDRMLKQMDVTAQKNLRRGLFHVEQCS